MRRKPQVNGAKKQVACTLRARHGCGRQTGISGSTGSNTLKYINLVGVAIGLVVLRGPMHLRACVIEKRGDGEGAGSYVLSDILGYINLTG